MQEIVRMEFGSKVYGTSIPSSDTDYAGIFIPDFRDILLGRAPKHINESTNKVIDSKNAEADTDINLYSLKYFIDMALEGEITAVDILHTPEKYWVTKFPYGEIWNNIVYNRDKFYTNNNKALIGYARKQASKYGCSSSRLHTVNEVIRILEELDK